MYIQTVFRSFLRKSNDEFSRRCYFEKCIARFCTSNSLLEDRETLAGESSASTTKAAQDKPDALADFELPAYTLAQQEIILKLLNDGTLEILTRFQVARHRAQNILKYREIHGKFNNITDVLKVDDFQNTFLIKFCNNVLKSFIMPTTPIKWRLCDTPVPAALKEWNFLRLAPRFRIYDHIHNLQSAHDVVSVLPMADVYLMRQYHLQQKSLAEVSMLRVVIQVESVLFTLLEERLADGGTKSIVGGDVATDSTRILSLKSKLIRKFCASRFDMDMHSTRHLLQQLAKDEQFKVESDLWDWYLAQDNIVQQQIAECVLRTIAFCKTEISDA